MAGRHRLTVCPAALLRPDNYIHFCIALLLTFNRGPWGAKDVMGEGVMSVAWYVCCLGCLLHVCCMVCLLYVCCLGCLLYVCCLGCLLYVCCLGCLLPVCCLEGRLRRVRDGS